jgi:hypothetical protein
MHRDRVAEAVAVVGEKVGESGVVDQHQSVGRYGGSAGTTVLHVAARSLHTARPHADTPDHVVVVEV